MAKLDTRGQLEAKQVTENYYMERVLKLQELVDHAGGTLEPENIREVESDIERYYRMLDDVAGQKKELLKGARA